MRRETKEVGKVCLSLTHIYPAQSWHQQQGGWWKNSKGSKNQASEVKKKGIFHSHQEEFTEFAAVQKTLSVI